jgi:hypothetical protein
MVFHQSGAPAPRCNRPRFAYTEGMNAIKATWKNGQIVPDVPVNWPEDCRLIVEPLPEGERVGIDESEWRDDPENLADWEAWIKTIRPLELTPEEDAAFARFDEEMRRYNVEAVRRQMEGGGLP